MAAVVIGWCHSPGWVSDAAKLSSLNVEKPVCCWPQGRSSAGALSCTRWSLPVRCIPASVASASKERGRRGWRKHHHAGLARVRGAPACHTARGLTPHHRPGSHGDIRARAPGRRTTRVSCPFDVSCCGRPLQPHHRRGRRSEVVMLGGRVAHARRAPHTTPCRGPEPRRRGATEGRGGRPRLSNPAEDPRARPSPAGHVLRGGANGPPVLVALGVVGARRVGERRAAFGERVIAPGTGDRGLPRGWRPAGAALGLGS